MDSDARDIDDARDALLVVYQHWLIAVRRDAGRTLDSSESENMVCG